MKEFWIAFSKSSVWTSFWFSSDYTTLKILLKFCNNKFEAAPCALCEPTSSWSNRHIKLTKGVSKLAEGLTMAFKAVKLETKLSILGEETNSSVIPKNDDG